MSFRTLNKDVLQHVADEFSVETDKNKTKAEMISDLESAGVTWEMYKEAFPDLEDLDDAQPAEEKATEEEPAKQSSAKPILIKMDRPNARYEIRGYRFTKDHPYVVVDAADADALLHVYGFRQATPEEVENYYS